MRRHRLNYIHKREVINKAQMETISEEQAIKHARSDEVIRNERKRETEKNQLQTMSNHKDRELNTLNTRGTN